MEKKAKVLIVDDDEIVLLANRVFLEGAGFEVVIEKSALKVSRLIQHDPPDLILLDVRMPALDGDQVISILQRYEFSCHIPILLFSDLDEMELAELADETGAVGWVKKSLGRDHLIERVKGVVEQLARV